MENLLVLHIYAEMRLKPMIFCVYFFACQRNCDMYFVNVAPSVYYYSADGIRVFILLTSERVGRQKAILVYSEMVSIS